MSNAIAPQTRPLSVPYITIQEYKNAPTSVDVTTLVVGGDQAAQDSELLTNIIRASSWIDTHCFQVISATTDVEQKTIRVRPNGDLIVATDYFPIVALTDFKYGVDNSSLNTLPDCSVAWLEDQKIEIPSQWLTDSSAFNVYSRRGGAGEKIKVRYTYVNGYANTLIANTVSAGATSISVQDGTGITAGHKLPIADGSLTETVTVDSSYVFGSTTVPITSPLLYAHAAGISISAIPAAIKQACILMTSEFLKIRGDSSLIMGVVNTPSGQTAKVISNKELAIELLIPYVRHF